MEEQTSDKSPYLIARDKQLAELEENIDLDRFRTLGATVLNDTTFTLPLLRWECRLELEPFSLTVMPEKRDLELTCQILLLDYLSAKAPRRPTKLISFAEFPEARGYQKPYQGRVIQRLTHTAGTTAKSFSEASERTGGEQAGNNPDRFFFRFFPLFELQLVRHEADEDFPHSCNLLFSDNALTLLSVESMIVCAEKLVSIMQGKTP